MGDKEFNAQLIVEARDRIDRSIERINRSNRQMADTQRRIEATDARVAESIALLRAETASATEV